MAYQFNLPILVSLVVFQGTISATLAMNHTTSPQVIQLAIEAAKECKAGPITDEYIKQLFEQEYTDASEYDYACTIGCALNEMHLLDANDEFDPKEALKLGDKIQGVQATKGQPRLGQMFVDECGKVKDHVLCDFTEKLFDCLKKVNAKWMKQLNN